MPNRLYNGNRGVNVDDLLVPGLEVPRPGLRRHIHVSHVLPQDYVTLIPGYEKGDFGMDDRMEAGKGRTVYLAQGRMATGCRESVAASY